jgi:hypothetical protein
MRCQCGNEIDVILGAKLISKGCKVLTAVTVVVTVQCEKCGAVFQLPIKNDETIVVEK